MYLTKNLTENCVMVRIMRQNVKYQKNFSKKKYGGWRKATAAAREWRDEQLAILPPKSKGMANKMTERNTSGAVGVTLAHTVVKRKDGDFTYWRWKAKWPGCKNRGGIGWSVQRFGVEDAFALAVLSRDLNSVNRKEVLKHFKRLQGTKKLKKIYDMRALDLE